MEIWATLFGCVSEVIKSGEGQQAAHTPFPQRAMWAAQAFTTRLNQAWMRELAWGGATWG